MNYVDAIAECHCSMELIIEQWHLPCSLFTDHLTFTLERLRPNPHRLPRRGHVHSLRVFPTGVLRKGANVTGGPGRARSSPTFSSYINPGGSAAYGPLNHPDCVIHSSYPYIVSKAISGGRIVLGNLLSWTPNRSNRSRPLDWQFSLLQHRCRT